MALSFLHSFFSQYQHSLSHLLSLPNFIIVFWDSGCAHLRIPIVKSAIGGRRSELRGRGPRSSEVYYRSSEGGDLGAPRSTIGAPRGGPRSSEGTIGAPRGGPIGAPIVPSELRGGVPRSSYRSSDLRPPIALLTIGILKCALPLRQINVRADF